MPLLPELPTFDQDQIHQAALRRLAGILARLQRSYAGDFRQVPQGQTPAFPIIDMFPAIVRSDGGSDGVPQYTDGVRYYLDRAATSEGLGSTDQFNATAETIPGYKAIVTATNLAAIPTAGRSVPVPAATIVHCFRLANRGTAEVDGDATPSAPLYVFYWSPPADVLVRIDSNAAGGGCYGGTVFSGVMSADGTSNFALPQGLSAGQSCLVENLDEQGQPTHWLTADGSAYAEGVYAGTSTEETPRPIVRVQRGVYRTDDPQPIGSSSAKSTPLESDGATWKRSQTTAGTDYGDTPIQVWCVTAVGYDPTASTPQLLAYVRPFVYAADGRLDSVGAESSYVVDEPDTDCGDG
jgi:hypothetical protein